MALAPARAALQKTMAATVADEQHHGNWRYHAVRPEYVPHSYVNGMHVEADCSKGVQMLCRWTPGAPDPMRNGWAPYGNSSTIWLVLHHIDLEDAQPGDDVVFGYRYGEKHACKLWEKYGPGKYDWWVWNMGQQGQPAKRRLVDEIAAHHGMEMTVCRLPISDPPPTPQEKLRSKTGFYAWLAWALGEGPWKHYGKANQSVRPDVPKVIPLAWWRHRAAFLMNRKRGNAAS